MFFRYFFVHYIEYCHLFTMQYSGNNIKSLKETMDILQNKWKYSLYLHFGWAVFRFYSSSFSRNRTPRLNLLHVFTTLTQLLGNVECFSSFTFNVISSVVGFECTIFQWFLFVPFVLVSFFSPSCFLLNSFFNWLTLLLVYSYAFSFLHFRGIKIFILKLSVYFTLICHYITY